MELVEQAVRLFKNKQYEGALVMADQLIEAQPSVGMSWRFRGECLYALARWEAAAEAFGKAMLLGGPGTEETVFWKAFSEREAGWQEKALETLEAFLASRPSEALAQKARQILAAFR